MIKPRNSNQASKLYPGVKRSLWNEFKNKIRISYNGWKNFGLFKKKEPVPSDVLYFDSELAPFLSNLENFLDKKKELKKKKDEQGIWLFGIRGGSIANENMTLKNSDALVEEKPSRTKVLKIWSLLVENLRPVFVPVVTATILEWIKHDREDESLVSKKLSSKVDELEKVVTDLQEKTKPAENLTNTFIWCMSFLFLTLWFLENLMSKGLISGYAKENSFYLTCLEIAHSLLIRVVFFRDYKEYNKIPFELRENYDELIDDIHKYYEFAKKYKNEMKL